MKTLSIEPLSREARSCSVHIQNESNITVAVTSFHLPADAAAEPMANSNAENKRISASEVDKWRRPNLPSSAEAKKEITRSQLATIAVTRATRRHLTPGLILLDWRNAKSVSIGGSKRTTMGATIGTNSFTNSIRDDSLRRISFGGRDYCRLQAISLTIPKRELLWSFDPAASSDKL